MTRTKFYHVDEVAELLGVSLNEVRDMLKRKELKGHKLGRRWLIDMQQSCFENLTLPTPPPIPEKQEPILRYIKDSEHEEVLREYLFSVKKSLYIATANFKNVFIDGDNLVSILNKMVYNGIRVTVICSKLHTKEKCDFELIVCKRNHMKLFIFDKKVLYIGSANLTPAALARTSKSKKTNNHEAGILTNNMNLLLDSLLHFKKVYHEDDCETCKIKTCEFNQSEN